MSSSTSYYSSNNFSYSSGNIDSGISSNFFPIKKLDSIECLHFIHSLCTCLHSSLMVKVGLLAHPLWQLELQKFSYA